jgi:aspartyl-tRNA(Asn)/glutamyl-tRNA(Gln) amidotransferase subunit B
MIIHLSKNVRHHRDFMLSSRNPEAKFYYLICIIVMHHTRVILGLAQQRGYIRPVIGLEIHVKLGLLQKLFSNSSSEYAASEPNKHIVPFDLGFPGTMPQLKFESILLALKASIAFQCSSIAERLSFDRKHYFYHDLPLGYQITQYSNPIARNGILHLEDDSPVLINRIQLEQDTAKTYESSQLLSIDFNRSGIALIEIVTLPHITSSKQAMKCVGAIQKLARLLNISDCNMEQGSMRCDVNVSLSEDGTSRKWPRCEIKNVVSIAALGLAIDAEVQRQISLLESGHDIISQTLSFDIKSKQLAQLRQKDQGLDYRYAPEPDLPEFNIPEELVNSISVEVKQTLNNINVSKSLDLQDQIDFGSQYHLKSTEVQKLLKFTSSIDYFKNTLSLFISKGLASTDLISASRLVYTWITQEIFFYMKQYSKSTDLMSCKIKPEFLSHILFLLHIKKSISKPIARKVLSSIMEQDAVDGIGYIDSKLVELENSSSDISLIEDFIDVESRDFKKGQDTNIDALVYKVMKRFQCANVNQVRDLLKKRLQI